IRDRNVTGVQSCALPIWIVPSYPAGMFTAMPVGMITECVCVTIVSSEAYMSKPLSVACVLVGSVAFGESCLICSVFIYSSSVITFIVLTSPNHCFATLLDP